MEQPLIIGGVEIQVTRKRIKTLRLRVCPPDGEVRLSVPLRTSKREIRAMIEERLPWIRKHQAAFLARPRPRQLQFVCGEIHYLFDQPLCLQVTEQGRTSRVQRRGTILHLSTPPGSSTQMREALLDRWYRAELRQRVPALLDKWQPVIGVKVNEWSIKKMKTRWGTCNISKRRIWLNLMLAKKPAICLEYILVHELVHLLERYHNARFYHYMDSFLPQWRDCDKLLTEIAQ